MITSDRHSVIITIGKGWLANRSKTCMAADGLLRLLVGEHESDWGGGYQKIHINPDCAIPILNAVETAMLLRPE